MSLPTVFATLAAGNQPASLLDTMFNTVAGMGIIECTATGANTITLTPVANMPTVSAYTALMAFSFVAAANSTAVITVNVSAVGALPLLGSNGVQLGSGAILTGQVVLILTDGAGNAWMVSPSNNTTATVVSVKRQAFTANGTYTPSAGMLFADIEALGGGGGGGGAVAAGATFVAAAGGGGMGGYAKGIFTAVQVGASKAITIGTAGTAGAAGANNGGTGGITTVAALLTANGGVGGVGAAAVTAGGNLGGTGGTASGGISNVTGWSGQTGIGQSASALSGAGANSPYGTGGKGIVIGNAAGQAAGAAATGNGAGGSGGCSNNGGTAVAGGAGTAGYVIITEYCSQ